MNSIAAKEIADQRRQYNKWIERASKKPKKQESSDDFAARGGVITLVPPVKIDLTMKYKQCCTATFQNII